MPKSRSRRKPKPTQHTTDHSAEERARQARRDEIRRRVGWPLAVAGAVLFILGQVGSRTGIVFLPFDRHHVISQVGGFFLAIRGLTWAWR